MEHKRFACLVFESLMVGDVDDKGVRGFFDVFEDGFTVGVVAFKNLGIHATVPHQTLTAFAVL